MNAKEGVMQPKVSLQFQGSLKDVATLAWPLMVGMLSFTIMDVTDTFMVGQIGKRELAAVGMATTIIFFINSFFIGFFESVKILVAQATGAKQSGLAKEAVWQGVFLSIPCGVIVMALAFFNHTIFGIFGGSLPLQEMARDYFSIRVIASPFWFITLAIGSYYQGIGNTKLPMFINLMMCVLNGILCQLFIFGFGPIQAMGMDGSAYATILSDVVGMVVLLTYLIKDAKIPLKWFTNTCQKLFKLGLPVGIRWLLDTGGWTFVIAMIARLGEDELAANQIATKIMCLSILPVYGITETASILTGQCTGAQNMKALHRSYWSAVKLALMIMGSFGIIFWTMPTALVSLFQSDQAVIELASQVLMVLALFQLIVAFSMTTAGALNGTGDTRFTMYLSISTTWLFMIPLAYCFGFTLGYGMFGMWIALILQELLLAAATQWRFRSGKWKRHGMVS